MPTLTTFPHLTQSEFNTSCTTLQQHFTQHKNTQQTWSSVELYQNHDEVFLRITKPLATSPPPTTAPIKAKAQNDDDVEEPDDEDMEELHDDEIEELDDQVQTPLLYYH